MKEPPAYYPIPRERLDGRSAEMAFADALYYLAATQGWAIENEIKGAYAVDVDFNLVSELSGIDNSTVNEEADHAMRLGWIKRSGLGDRATEQIYILEYAKIANGSGAPHKPIHYVQNGWLRSLYKLDRSFLLQRVLNVIWLMRFGNEPRQISLEELRAKAVTTNSRPIARSRIMEKVDMLERAGIILPENGGYRLNRECFNTPAPKPEEIERRWDRRRLIAAALYQQLAAQDAQRAALALDILLAGHFDPEHELQKIFDDLRFAAGETAPLLSLARRRPKHNNQPGWEGLWKNYVRQSKHTALSAKRLQSNKYVVEFDDLTQQTGLLGLVGVSADRVSELWLRARARSKFETRQKMRAAQALPEVRFQLNNGDADLASGSLQLGEHTQIAVPLNSLGERSQIVFTLLVYAEKPLGGVWLEAWLEAEPK